MIFENDKLVSNNMLEDILDQACLDEGLDPEELRLAKQIALIEEFLVEQGRPIKDIYREWSTKTRSEIVAEYAHLNNRSQ